MASLADHAAQMNAMHQVERMASLADHAVQMSAVHHVERIASLADHAAQMNSLTYATRATDVAPLNCVTELRYIDAVPVPVRHPRLRALESENEALAAENSALKRTNEAVAAENLALRRENRELKRKRLLGNAVEHTDPDLPPDDSRY